MPTAGGRLGAIDLLRFVAAVAVMVYHFTALGPFAGHVPQQFPDLLPVSRYGYLGVELFFLISGFVIVMSIEGRTSGQFIAARARRLYPAFWASCSLTALVVLSPTWTDAWRYLANMTLFAPYLGQQSIDGVYWSLYMEVRFYLFVAVIIAIGQARNLQAFMAAWLALSALHLVIPIPRGPGLFLVEFAPLFVAGAIYSAIARNGAGRWNLVTLAAAVTLSVIYAVRRDTPLGGDPLTIAGVILAFHAVMAAIASGRWPLRPNPTLLWLGSLSYPIYLLHNEIGNAMLRLLSSHVTPLLALAIVMVAIGLGALVLHLVAERRRSGRPAWCPALRPG